MCWPCELPGLKEGKKNTERGLSYPTPDSDLWWHGVWKNSSLLVKQENVRYCLTTDIGLCLTKVEVDADLHLALQDATGAKAGIVVCEIPAKQQWCSILQTVFSWSPTRFPFQIRSTMKLKVIKPPIIKSFDRQLFRPGPAQCSAPLRGASLDL